MKLRPLGKRLVVEYIEEEKVLASGIVLPDASKDIPDYAIVVEVGEKISGHDKRSQEVKVGDKVIFAKYSGTEVEIGDRKLHVIEYDDIVAVVEED